MISLLVGVNAVWFIGLRSAQWTREIAGSFEDSKDETAYLAQNLQGYDMNADSSTIEVVDSESRPVLQFARDEGGLVGWIVTRQKSGDERQRRIFQYPGHLHPGAREH